jgi:outer membrane protein assembly factor BamA
VALALALRPAPAAARAGREINFVPIVGGDSDIGLGAGVVGDWAAIADGQRPPFRWRLEVASFTTVKFGGEQGFLLPYQDYYLQLTIPRFGPADRYRLDLKPEYTNEHTLKYYGLGNASPPRPADVPLSGIEHTRVHATMSAEVRTRVVGPLFVLLGTSYTENRLEIGPDTVLAREQAGGPTEVRRLLGTFGPHGVQLFTVEAQYDSRDDEIVTTSGQLHTLRFRVSPRLGDHVPYQYERLTLTSRLYHTLIERWLVVSARAVGDVLVGDVPFYELARFDETSAVGGSKALRGVPANRYYGRIKAFGNLQFTSSLWRFSIRGKPMVLGPAAFVDVGRSWTELTRAHPELDGTGWGLKYGVGGGIRLQQGKTFVVRLDVAWSPDAEPVGAYFAAGEIF